MPRKTEGYDALIIGGGIFGAYAALYLSEKGRRVILLEKEKQLFTKASVVNQARLHGGYHYPRSIATARMSDENKNRFTREHQDFINFAFPKYYGIDRYGSLTDGLQFERFCNYLQIPCKPVKKHAYINLDRLEALYKTEEYSFDPVLMADYYRSRIEKDQRITVKKHARILGVEIRNGDWEVEWKYLDRPAINKVRAHLVLNATYSASNTLNRQFGQEPIQLMHEIAEMVFVSSPQVSNLGLTVMDGQFASLMPYGMSGLLSLSSVAYTHHKVSYRSEPVFDCQAKNPDCRPDFISNCNYCPARPQSHQRKMIRQIQQYFLPQVQFNYFYSMFTIKSKLRANYIDDGRPTEIRCLQETPPFFCIFAGKINSIYEIEKVI